MNRITAGLCLVLCLVLSIQNGYPRDRTLSTEEKTQLTHVDTVRIQAIALTEKGTASTQEILQVVSQRLQELGFTTHDDPKAPYHVVVKVKCEERKTRIGPSRYGGDADSLHAPSRSWRGPACQITYGLDGQDTAWRKEVRTEFNNARRAARAAKIQDSGQYAITALTKILERDNFPYLLAAEWGQANRLSQILEKPETPQALKLQIISLLGEITEAEVLPSLKRALQDPSLAPSAAMAIGRQGEQATEVLLTVLQTAKDSNLKVSAVNGLGEIATHHSQAPVFTPFITALQEPTTELPVQTAIVMALGKLADQRAVEPLTELNRKAWTDSSRDIEMQKLRDALSWSLWQLNPDAHAGE
ncbi:MAG: HEAT repeat domain-containing protein [Nitrospirales bacterium]